MAIIETMETILKGQVEARVAFLENLYGVACKIYKVKENVFSTVYGKESGEELSAPVSARFMITNDSFTPMDSHSAGTLTEGWIYSNTDKLNVGDRVEVSRSDGRSRAYKVDGIFTLGSSTSVIKRYKIISLGD